MIRVDVDIVDCWGIYNSKRRYFVVTDFLTHLHQATYILLALIRIRLFNLMDPIPQNPNMSKSDFFCYRSLIVWGTILFSTRLNQCFCFFAFKN